METAMTCAAVAVARTGARALGERLEGALTAAGVDGAPPQVLGERHGQAAVEAHVAAADPQALQARLSGSLPDADVCVLPEAGRRKRLLICDMDSTVIEQECLDELADFAGLKAEISAITEQAMRGELDFEGALTGRVARLKGLGLDALDRCYRERLTLSPGARTLTATMAAAGARCVLVSGGFTFFTGRIAADAGFHAHRGNTLVDDGEALTGTVGQPILGRDAKRAALEEEAAALGLGPGAALAIGDGANDLAMIRAAGLGLAYRAKPVVAAEARAAIDQGDLVTALYFQGYHDAQIAWAS